MYFSNDKDLYKTIGYNIKRYRHQNSLTQRELASLAEISISYLSKLEASGCNKSLSISTLNKIANILQTDITDFFSSTEK